MAYRGCRVYSSDNQAITRLVLTLVEFDAETHDVTDFHDNTVNPSRITIPDGYDGVYRVFAQIRWEADGTGYRLMHILLNGSVIATYVHDADATDVTTTSILDSVTLVAGDYVEVQVYHTSDASRDVTTGTTVTFFGVDLLGA